MDIKNGQLVCNTDHTGTMYKVDLKPLFAAEKRQAEVAFVTLGKAPELLMVFIDAEKHIHETLCNLNYRRNAAKEHVSKVKAVFVLSKLSGVEKQLKAEGKISSSNADIRNSILELDAEYQESKAVVADLTFAIDYLGGKLSSVHDSHNAVKRLIAAQHSGSSFSGSMGGYNVNSENPDDAGFGKDV